MKQTKELWLAEPGFLARYLERVENATPAERTEAEKAFFDEPCTPEGEKQFPDILSIDGPEAIIKIEGFLSRSGPSRIDRFFGFTGTAYNDIIESLSIAANDPNVELIRLAMNTPGGTVDGTDDTFQAVVAAKKKKKIIAENHGLVASAGYWIAVGANKIIASSPSSETGSIGVIVVGFDITKMLDNEGIKRVVIVSKNAPKKHDDIGKKAGRDRIQDRIDALERVFISRVAGGRKVTIEHVKEKFGQGGLLIAQDPDSNLDDALSVNMIDEVKSLVAAIIDGDLSPVAKVDRQGATSDDSKPNNHPAKERKKMDLNQAIAEHPGIGVEVEAKEKASYEKGAQAAGDSKIAMIKKASVYLQADSSYPPAIKNLALKVLSGESNIDSLEGAVTAFDAAKEEDDANAAAKETKANGETPAETTPALSTDGIIKDEADLQAAAQRLQA